MKILAVHPSGLLPSSLYMRLEPLGLELVAQALRKAGHDVRLIDLQVEDKEEYFQTLNRWHPNVIAFSCNYLPNVPEIVDLAKATKSRLPESFVFVGGHSASFTAEDFLEHGEGAIDCVLRGEGEVAVVDLMNAVQHDRKAISQIPGVLSEFGTGPRPKFVHSIDDLSPARDLLRSRRKYFIGVLDPAASIEFSRGCPWDCEFCSAWTFYGRTYRIKSPEKAVEDLELIKESGVFIIDDVAFIHASHGFAIGEAIAKKGIKKKYYLETRGDVLLRNKEVFKFWKKLGLSHIFMGLEAIDSDGLEKFRKRVSLDKNFEALECARSLGITVAINIIADPSWDHTRFEALRQWSLQIPEILNISVYTPYPGAENWYTEERKLTTRDYRLFAFQHAVLPTRIPLEEFYSELIKTQIFFANKSLGLKGIATFASAVLQNLLRRQTNSLKLFWNRSEIYNARLQLADHNKPVKYLMPLPPTHTENIDSRDLYVHEPQGHAGRDIDDASE